ncbi:MAG: reverse transcriptase/maturase family protein [Treponema sp.]|jgi:retron-type reverse transcriptase|nr:reverse transcriptase/maturase family protein [Treponema sp.]
MPRTVTGLWHKVIDFENVYYACRAASRGKRYRTEVLAFNHRKEEHLITLINELVWDTYRPRPLRQFWITEPKKRLISAPDFRDRVAHHALCQVIEPILDNRFIEEAFACRIGKGTHAAMRHMAACARAARRQWGGYYALKCDVHKFFQSVDHEALKGIIRRTIRDPKVLHLIEVIIDSHDSGEHGKGIPIGALTSQLFANAYLNPLDRYLKEVHRVEYYARYMDDFVVLHHDKSYLTTLLSAVTDVLGELELTLNPKSGLFPGRHGIDFCGYRIWPTHVKPRKSAVKRAKRRLRKMTKVYQTNPGILDHAKASLNSFLGYIMHCNGWRSTQSLLKKIVFTPKGAHPLHE